MKPKRSRTKRLSEAKPIGTIPIKHMPEGTRPEDVYGLIVEGDCMNPVAKDGVTVVVDGSSHPGVGDLAVIWFKKGGFACKRIVIMPPLGMMKVHPENEVVALLIVEEINPLRHYSVTVDKIDALHKVIGVYLPECDEAETIVRSEDVIRAPSA